MAVGRVDDIYISPDQRAAWRCEVCLRKCATRMLVRVMRVIVFFPRAGAGRHGSEGKREQRGQLHLREEVDPVAGRSGGKDGDDAAAGLFMYSRWTAEIASSRVSVRDEVHERVTLVALALSD